MSPISKGIDSHQRHKIHILYHKFQVNAFVRARLQYPHNKDSHIWVVWGIWCLCEPLHMWEGNAVDRVPSKFRPMTYVYGRLLEMQRILSEPVALQVMSTQRVLRNTSCASEVRAESGSLLRQSISQSGSCWCLSTMKSQKVMGRTAAFRNSSTVL